MTFKEISPERRKRLEVLWNDAKKELRMLLLKSMMMFLGSIVPITLVSYWAGLLNTMFPSAMWWATAIVIHAAYLGPQSRKVTQKYAPQVKEILEEEKRDSSQEG